MRKGGWDIEVWSNGGYTLVLNNDGVSATVCPIRMNAEVIITRMPLEKLSKKIAKAATAMRKKESDRVIAEYDKVVLPQGEAFAMYVVGEVGEGETGQPFVLNAGLNAHIECLKEHCTEMGGRPVGYVTVRLKDGKPLYMYTYFFPKNEGCDCGQAGCAGGRGTRA